MDVTNDPGNILLVISLVIPCCANGEKILHVTVKEANQKIREPKAEKEKLINLPVPEVVWK
jgi:hypothetical protein